MNHAIASAVSFSGSSSQARRQAGKKGRKQPSGTWRSRAHMPVPHPSWFSDRELREEERLRPDEFWSRLGL